jgi:dCMP deaminase
MDWDQYLLGIARGVAAKSKDPNTKVGCVITSPDHDILATGYNGFPRGFKDLASRWERPLKYDYVIHAEENALLLAARRGIRLLGAQAYITIPPCNRCLLRLAQVGIRTIIVPRTHNEAAMISDHDKVIRAEILSGDSWKDSWSPAIFYCEEKA